MVVEQVSVDPAHQRRGIGTALLRAAEAWLADRPDLPGTLTLGVETGNAGAIRLYARLGYAFVRDGDAPFVFPGDDGELCYVMAKRLRQAAPDQR